MIKLNGQLICQNDAEAAIVRAHVAEHIRLTRAEPGCLSFEVIASDDPLIWEVAETFKTRQDFEAHQLRTRASDWFAATQDIRREFQVEEIEG
jgi:quinol monooxygenase YgiN